jgi:hypothetical protein
MDEVTASYTVAMMSCKDMGKYLEEVVE